jgi:hypothetical protein
MRTAWCRPPRWRGEGAGGGGSDVFYSKQFPSPAFLFHKQTPVSTRKPPTVCPVVPKTVHFVTLNKTMSGARLMGPKRKRGASRKRRLKALQPGPKSCHENLSTHAVMLTDDDDHFDSDITFAFEAHICS